MTHLKKMAFPDLWLFVRKSHFFFSETGQKKDLRELKQRGDRPLLASQACSLEFRMAKFWERLGAFGAVSDTPKLSPISCPLTENLRIPG